MLLTLNLSQQPGEPLGGGAGTPGSWTTSTTSASCMMRERGGERDMRKQRVEGQ